MIALKTSPVGIDVYIQSLQDYLYSSLVSEFGISESDYNAYGRCYKNMGDEGYIPQVYIGGEEYESVPLDDSVAIISFFGVSDTITFGINATTQVHGIFLVDLSKLTDVLHRGDEEVRVTIQRIFKEDPYGFTLNSIVTGLNSVLTEYTGWRSKIRPNISDNPGTRNIDITNWDMHPYHCFRVNTTLNYNIDMCDFPIN